MIDFNDAAPLEETKQPTRPERDQVRTQLLLRLEAVLKSLYPEGRVRRDRFTIGDVRGAAGDSLEVALSGEKAGLWNDHATGEGGDLFDLVAAQARLDARRDFAAVLSRAAELVGHMLAPAAASPTKKRRSEPALDEFGPHTARWDYLSADGELIACVYRYDPPEGKQYRPWDAKRRKHQAPTPRPLYNQPGVAAATEVVLVEGEKSANALIERGACATTSMNGANAPIDKTDWSPLCGKHVLIWPDKDKPGWEYAMQAAQAAFKAGADSCALLHLPDDKPLAWDAADAAEDGFDIDGFLRAGERTFLSPGNDDAPPPIDFDGLDWSSDDGLGLAFTRHFVDDWRYCAAWGQWLSWTGARWNPDRTLVLQHLVRGVCRAAQAFADKPSQRSKLASASTVGGVERLARSDPRHASFAEDWDRDLWALNTPNGIVDLRSGQLRRHARGEHMTKLTTASPGGECPIWRNFLGGVTGGDGELAGYLQRVVGYCLTGVTREHALFFLYGTGANGKSVFVNTIATILGDYGTNAPMDTFMESRGDRHPTDLAGLRGARFVAASETEQGRRWNEAKLKAITGGDKISARFMRQDFFEYIPQFKLVIAGNHKPAIRNVDEAMKRRLHMVPFTVTIPPERRDGRLTEKLLAERDGIMAWAVQGCLDWQRVGLRPPQCVVDATEEYFEEEDRVGEFISEDCYVHCDARVSIEDVFHRWRERGEQRGEYVGTSRWLVQQLMSRGFTRMRLTGGVKGLVGISLKPRSQNTRLPYADN
ncbi:phage/plasmid primase, P4 family [Lysobacter antibioticus]|uniref:Phage/plasmid primase, P4 family, C-terminal domain protein n=1 Tax=Lysobacter antibioticus TaxID=84531 RepID=A0A0S2FHP9_LYSAN|nr:phage/plasmid primase, P4 family [Lysobacter antibioticus]ALN83038.1 phage/plasmid primase, P4 family, C-terminal domain protein [Lysobacter antibioticus]